VEGYERMRIRKTIVLAVVLILAVLTACADGVTVSDGVYRAEYSDYDAKGYKDFVELTFEGGKVTKVVADAVSGKDGTLKSESPAFRDEMESISGTYPEKYYADLINQYLANPDSSSIDVVAGATESSESFIVLLKALEKAIRANNYTGTVIVNR